ncbi:MAG: preprotein translocase subunit YajC [Deltaproteobacteria bacterium]|nr:preprotein translocase subunit YajC [Deltaproteobacteria bacterium]
MFSSVAYAMAGGASSGSGGGGIFGAMLPLILMFVIFYFLLIRPQQKKAKSQRQWLNDLKKGDRVVTNGGLHGEITGLTDVVVTLEIAPKIRVKVSRSALAASLSSPTAQTEPAGDDSKE